MGDGDLGMIVETSRASTSSVQCGSVEVAFDYEAAARKMTAHIIQARGIPSKDIGGANNTQVRSLVNARLVLAITSLCARRLSCMSTSANSQIDTLCASH